MQILIKNAFVVDGTNQKPFLGAVLIEDDLIVAVYKNDSLKTKAKNTQAQIIDAKNSYLTPGFIDVHSHADFANFTPSDLKAKITQGVTTEIVGQCGFSAAPMPKEKSIAWREVSLIDDKRVSGSFESMHEYFSALKAHGFESNLISLVGHATLRFAVAGNAPRVLTDDELLQLEKLASKSFAEGAAGLSFGLIYYPAFFADEREIETLVKTAAKYQKIICIHLRSESDELIEAILEILTLCKKHQAQLHISHLKAIGKKNWGKLDQALDIISENNLTFDHYPYIGGATTFMAIFPPKIFANLRPTETIFTRLAEVHIKNKLRQIFAGKLNPEKHTPWDNLPLLVGWDKIIITILAKPQNQAYLGLSIQEIANLQKKDPTDVAIDLAISENGKIFMLDFYAEESSVIKKLQHKNGVIGSDSNMVAIGKYHPRVFGNFPRIISEYVFKQSILPIETAVFKITGQPAKIFALNNRGIIAPGFKADLLIFNRDFKDNATFKHPEEYATGLEYVFINGRLKRHYTTPRSRK